MNVGAVAPAAPSAPVPRSPVRPLELLSALVAVLGSLFVVFWMHVIYGNWLLAFGCMVAFGAAAQSAGFFNIVNNTGADTRVRLQRELATDALVRATMRGGVGTTPDTLRQAFTARPALRIASRASLLLAVVSVAMLLVTVFSSVPPAACACSPVCVSVIYYARARQHATVAAAEGDEIANDGASSARRRRGDVPPVAWLRTVFEPLAVPFPAPRDAANMTEAAFQASSARVCNEGTWVLGLRCAFYLFAIATHAGLYRVAAKLRRHRWVIAEDARRVAEVDAMVAAIEAATAQPAQRAVAAYAGSAGAWGGRSGAPPRVPGETVFRFVPGIGFVPIVDAEGAPAPPPAPPVTLAAAVPDSAAAADDSGAASDDSASSASRLVH